MTLNISTSRLAKELRALDKDPPPGIVCYPIDDDMTKLESYMKGPPDSPYEKGLFQLEIRIPQQYPFEPPQIRFKTPVYHPNIDDGGRICIDILKGGEKGAWKPSMNIATTLISLNQLLACPNPDDPLDAEIAKEYQLDHERFLRNARALTLKYATGQHHSAETNDPMDAPLNETAFTEPAGIALCKTTDTASASNGKSRLSLSKRKQKAKTNPPSSDPTDNDASTDTALTFSSSSSSSQKQVSANKQPVTPTADTRSETDNKKLPEEAPSLQSKSSAENGVEIPLCDAENSDHDKADGFGRNNAIPCGNPQNHLQESAVEESLAGTCSEAQEPLNASFELAFTNISVTSCDEGTKEDEAPPSSEPSPPRETSPLSEEDDESTTLKMEKEAAKENNMTNKTKCPLAMSQEPSAAGEKRPTSVPNSVASVEEIHASLSTRGSSQPLGNVPSKLLQDHFTNSQPLLPMINDDDDIVIESRLTKAKRTKVNKLSLSRTKKRKIN